MKNWFWLNERQEMVNLDQVTHIDFRAYPGAIVYLNVWRPETEHIGGMQEEILLHDKDKVDLLNYLMRNTEGK